MDKFEQLIRGAERNDELMQLFKEVRKAQFAMEVTRNKQRAVRRNMTQARRTMAETHLRIQGWKVILTGPLRDEYRSRRRQYDDAVLEFSKKSCIAFCEAFHRTLPPELREMVYDHLYPVDRCINGTCVEDPNAHDMSIYESAANQNTYHPFASYFEPKRPKRNPFESCLFVTDLYHFYDQEFSGSVAKELVQHVYRCTDYFFRVESLQLLGRFFETDIFGFGIIPEEIVQHISISISYILGSTIYSRVKEEVAAGLQKICTMKNRTAHINIRVTTDPQNPNALDDLMRHVAGQIYELRDIGFNVACFWRPISRDAQNNRFRKTYELRFPRAVQEFLAAETLENLLVERK